MAHAGDPGCVYARQDPATARDVCMVHRPRARPQPGGTGVREARAPGVDVERALKDEQIIACTGARIAEEQQRAANAQGDGKTYQVQFDGAWINVDYDTYERVRQIQDSCA